MELTVLGFPDTGHHQQGMVYRSRSVSHSLLSTSKKTHPWRSPDKKGQGKHSRGLTSDRVGLPKKRNRSLCFTT